MHILPQGRNVSRFTIVSIIFVFSNAEAAENSVIVLVVVVCKRDANKMW